MSAKHVYPPRRRRSARNESRSSWRSARGAALLLCCVLSGCGNPPTPTSLPDAEGGLQAKEAPELARRVAEGRLPPLSARLPTEPLVVRPCEQPGYYGGTWHVMVDNPDLGMYKMIAGYAPLTRWRADCQGLEPGIATAWEYNREGTQLTLHLRHGVKWSDGVEYTSADFAYWGQLCEGKQQRLTWPFWTIVDGKEPTIETPDKYTIVMKFAGPNWFVPLQLATGYWNSDDYNTPRHYLQQFDPKYNPQYRDYSVFDKKNLSHFNPDRPTLWPWKLKAIEDGGFRMVFARNPYYYMVDTAGRQLPYIDNIVAEYVPNEQVRVLKILSGEIDAQFRLIELRDIGMYMDGRARGDYRVIRWSEASGGNSSLLLNWSTPDAGLRELIRDVRFRKALSLAIDRDKCNQVAWRGLATPQQATVSREGWHFQTPEGRAVFDAWARSYADYDLRRANRYLDAMGLTRRDGDGFRVRKDGGRLSLMIDVSAQSQTGPEADEALIIADGWRKLGIDVLIHTWPAAEYTLRQKLSQYETSFHGEAEMDLFTYPDWVFPTNDTYWHGAVGKWYRTGGKEGEAPTGLMVELLDIYKEILKQKDIRRAHGLVLKAVRLHTREGLLALGTAARTPSLVIVKNRFRNVPETVRILGPWAVSGPASSYPESFFFAPKGWTPARQVVRLSSVSEPKGAAR